MMDLDEFIQNTLKFQSIPSPTFHEESRAGFLLESFSDLGMTDAYLDEEGNVLARLRGGEGKPIIVSAHLDTVFPADTPLLVTRKRDRIEGPGIGDNAIGLAALLELGKFFTGNPPLTDVWLVGTVAEEGLGNLRGIKSVVDTFFDDAAAYVVIEGMALGYLYHKGLPVIRYKVEARSKGGHSWIHVGRESAIHGLLKFSSSILELRLPAKPKTILNIGTIHGGTSVNTIANHAWMELDIRSEDQKQADDVEAQIRELGNEFVKGDLSIKFEEIGRRPGGELAPEHPLVRSALDSYKAVADVECILETGSTDASYPLSLGLPAICVGITKGGEAHSMQEYIEIEPIQRGFSALTNLLITFPNLSKNTLPPHNH